ncbi:MAG: hypothetical protein ACTSWN_00485 [Promethearchaeota archaeon]
MIYPLFRGYKNTCFFSWAFEIGLKHEKLNLQTKSYSFLMVSATSTGDFYFGLGLFVTLFTGFVSTSFLKDERIKNISCRVQEYTA